MVTKNALRWFSVLAMVGFGLFSGVAFAAPAGSADSDSCPPMSSSINSQECTAAGASAALVGEDMVGLFALTGHPAISLSAPAVMASHSPVLTGEEMAALFAADRAAASASQSDPATVASNSAILAGQDVAALFARIGHPAVSLSAQAPVAGNSAVLTGEEMAALWAKTASAAPVTFADSAACREMSFHVDALSYNKSPCATTGASQIIPMTGTYLPDSSFHTPQTSDYPAGR